MNVTFFLGQKRPIESKYVCPLDGTREGVKDRITECYCCICCFTASYYCTNVISFLCTHVYCKMVLRHSEMRIRVKEDLQMLHIFGSWKSHSDHISGYSRWCAYTCTDCLERWILCWILCYVATSHSIGM